MSSHTGQKAARHAFEKANGGRKYTLSAAPPLQKEHAITKNKPRLFSIKNLSALAMVEKERARTRRRKAMRYLEQQKTLKEEINAPPKTEMIRETNKQARLRWWSVMMAALKRFFSRGANRGK